MVGCYGNLIGRVVGDEVVEYFKTVFQTFPYSQIVKKSLSFPSISTSVSQYTVTIIV
jgi:hypothetical protein